MTLNNEAKKPTAFNTITNFSLSILSCLFEHLSFNVDRCFFFLGISKSFNKEVAFFYKVQILIISF